MGGFEIIIKKNDVPDNAEPVGKDAKLVRITEMPIYVHLFCVGAGSGCGRHEAVSHLVGVNIRLILIKNFEFFNEGIEGLGVVFRDKKFDAGGVKGKDLCQRGIDELADWFGKIDHLSEHEFNKGLEVLPEPGKKRGVGDFGETAEIPKFFTDRKEKNE